MHRLTLRCLFAGLALGCPVVTSVVPVSAAAQVAASPAQPAAAAPAQPRPRRPAARPAARLALNVEVTDAKGTPASDVAVRMTGPVEREGTTDAQGAVAFVNLRAGTYRLRFERDTFVTLERELVLAAGGRDEPVSVMLTEAPPLTVVAAPPPSEERAEEARPVGEPRTVQVPEFTESNFIGRNEPQKMSVLGCTGYSTTRLLQVRDPLEQRTNADADETLYVVAGEAMLRLGGIDRPMVPGALAVIPRGMPHSLSRKGRNPAIFVSVLSGPACVP